MALHVAKAVLRLTVLRLTAAVLFRAAAMLFLSPRGRGTVRRNVAAADAFMTATALLVPPFLCVARRCQRQDET
jgi:hypothetical protein